MATGILVGADNATRERHLTLGDGNAALGALRDSDLPYTESTPAGGVVPFGQQVRLDEAALADLARMTPTDFAKAHPAEADGLSKIGQNVLNDTLHADDMPPAFLRLSGDNGDMYAQPSQLAFAVMNLAMLEMPGSYRPDNVGATTVMDMTQPDADGLIELTVGAALYQAGDTNGLNNQH